MKREEFERQLAAWLAYMREEAMVLFDKGVGPESLMGVAYKIADARLTADVRERQALALSIPGRAQMPRGGIDPRD